MRSLLFGALLLIGCGDDPSGMLTLMPDATTVVVGASTLVGAFLINGTSSDQNTVSASWSATPDGLITLTSSTNNLQKVTGVAPGNVVVTAMADGQMAEVGFTITSP